MHGSELFVGGARLANRMETAKRIRKSTAKVIEIA